MTSTVIQFYNNLSMYEYHKNRSKMYKTPICTKPNVRFSYLISHFMQLLKAIGLGSRASRKYTRKVHAAAPAHEACFVPTN